jgi:hypothetical protein
MPKHAVRASAKAMPKSDPHPDAERNAAIAERMNSRHNQPGLYEKGLEVLAKEISDNEVDRKILALHAEFKQLQAKASSLRTRFAPLAVAFAAITSNDRAERAMNWGHQSEYWALIDEIADLEERRYRRWHDQIAAEEAGWNRRGRRRVQGGSRPFLERARAGSRLGDFSLNAVFGRPNRAGQRGG